jgi:hypothetical protein
MKPIQHVGERDEAMARLDQRALGDDFSHLGAPLEIF